MEKTVIKNNEVRLSLKEQLKQVQKALKNIDDEKKARDWSKNGKKNKNSMRS